VYRFAVFQLSLALVLLLVKATVGVETESKTLVMSTLFSLQSALWAAVAILEGGRRSGRGVRRDAAKIKVGAVGALSLIVMAGVVLFFSGVLHDVLAHRQHPPGMPSVWAALGSVGIASIMLIHATGRSVPAPSMNGLERSLWADILASLSAIPVFIIAERGFFHIDSLVGLMGASYVVWAACGKLSAAVRALMDGGISREERRRLDETVEGMTGTFSVASLVAIRVGRRVEVRLRVAFPHTTRLADVERVRQAVAVRAQAALGDAVDVLLEVTDEPLASRGTAHPARTLRGSKRAMAPLEPAR
jgi:divalent metal cation (Fe/Co/Zn/Cd) transporter